MCASASGKDSCQGDSGGKSFVWILYYSLVIISDRYLALATKNMLFKITFKCSANLGPLTTKSGNNYYQTGVVSWGFGCAQVRI